MNLEQGNNANLEQAILAIAQVLTNNRPTAVAFRAYHNTAQNSGNANFAAMSFNTEVFDIGSCFASNEFTATETGIYLFSARAHTTSGNTRFFITLYADKGSGYAEEARGTDDADGGNSPGTGSNVTAIMYLTTGQKVKVYSFGSSTLSMDGQANTCFFQGVLLNKYQLA